MSLVPLYRSEAGVQHFLRYDGDGKYSCVSVADCEPILDRNKAMATHNDGYSPSRELRRAASIPLILVHKWLLEEGWNAFDPACADKLKAKLNSADYQYLRTAPGRL